jgi:hypothetical protein
MANAILRDNVKDQMKIRWTAYNMMNIKRRKLGRDRLLGGEEDDEDDDDDDCMDSEEDGAAVADVFIVVCRLDDGSQD